MSLSNCFVIEISRRKIKVVLKIYLKRRDYTEKIIHENLTNMRHSFLAINVNERKKMINIRF